MAAFVVGHGAWSAAWAWKKMYPRLRALGHELYAPTYTGIGERAHLASPHLDLEAHIADMLAARMLEAARTAGEGWRIPPNPMPPDTSAADVDWAQARRSLQPIKTFEQRLKISGAAERLPRTYIAPDLLAGLLDTIACQPS